MRICRYIAPACNAAETAETPVADRDSIKLH